VGLSLSDISLLLDREPKMKGSVRTLQNCPICKRPFEAVPQIGLICPEHKTFPARFFISIYWKGLIRIYSDKNGEHLDSFKRALKLLAKINWEIDNHVFDRSHYCRKDQLKFRVNGLLEKYLKAKEKKIRPSYYKTFRAMVNRASEHWGIWDIREIRKFDLVEYEESLPYKGKTLKNYMDHFKAFMNWVRTDLELISALPSFPETESPKPKFRWLSQDDQAKLFAYVRNPDKPIIGFLMLHGCRPGEARALRGQDVDLESRTLKISGTFSGNVFMEGRKGRGAQDYVIPVHPECWPYIQGRVKGSLPGAWLFPNPRTGDAYQQGALRRIWEDVRLKAGLDKSLRLYDATRHTFASLLRKSGIDLQNIRDHLGHSDSRTTEKYSHGSIEGLRADLGKLTLNKVVDLKTKEVIK
jgi:integrase